MINIDLLLGQTELSCQLFPLSRREIFLHDKITLKSAHLLCCEACTGLFPIILPWLRVLLQAKNVNNQVRGERFLFPLGSPVQRLEALTSILTQFPTESQKQSSPAVDRASR